MLNDPIVIVSAARTPMGAFQGELKGFAAPELGAAAIRAAIDRAGVKPEQVEEVIMGCVLLSLAAALAAVRVAVRLERAA